MKCAFTNRKKYLIIMMITIGIISVLSIWLLSGDTLIVDDSLYDKSEEALNEIDSFVLSNHIDQLGYEDQKEVIKVTKNSSLGPYSYTERKDIYYKDISMDYAIKLDDNSDAVQRELLKLKFEFNYPDNTMTWENHLVKMRVTLVEKSTYIVLANGVLNQVDEDNEIIVPEILTKVKFDSGEYVEDVKQELLNSYYYNKNNQKPEILSYQSYRNTDNESNPITLKLPTQTHNALRDVGDYYEIGFNLLMYGTGDNQSEYNEHELEIDTYLHVYNDDNSKGKFDKKAFQVYKKSFRYSH